MVTEGPGTARTPCRDRRAFRDDGLLLTNLTACAVGPQGYHRRYAGRTCCVPQARHDVEMILSTWHLEELSFAGALVVTELMSNAVSHCTNLPVTMKMVRTETGIRICVIDSCRRIPLRREATNQDEGGRGLTLIDALATDWNWGLLRGSDARLGRKQVWADLAA
jgi:hypothetical protein